MQAVERVTMLLIVALATGWVLYTSAPHGIGITPDSVHYLSAAQNLAKTGSLYTYTDKPLVSWAPLLPSLYAVGYLIGVQGETAAVVVNVVSFVLILFISGLWISQFLRGSAFAVAMLAVLLAKPVLFCALYAWSELPFVALTIIALYTVWRYVHSGKKSDWWVAAIVGALCPLMRYIGTSVTLCGTVFLLVYPYQTLRRRVFVAAGYLLATSLPLGLWLVRNKVVSGTLMGVREASDYALKDILWDTLSTWHSWFVPVDFAKSRTLLVVFLLMAAVVIVSFIARHWRCAPEPLHAALLLLSMFVVAYGGQLVWSAATVRFDNLDTRFWMPVAAPLAMVGSMVAWVGRRWGTLAVPLTLLVTFLALGWGMSGVAYARGVVGSLRSMGLAGSIRAPRWRQSEMVEYLRKHRLKGTVYTNAAPEIFYLTGISARWLPYKGTLRVAWENDVQRWHEFVVEVLHERSTGNRVYVVWSSLMKHRGYLYNPDDLQKVLDVNRQVPLADGMVLVVNSSQKHASGVRPR